MPTQQKSPEIQAAKTDRIKGGKNSTVKRDFNTLPSIMYKATMEKIDKK